MAKGKMSRTEREMDALMKRVARELKAKERLMHPKELESLKEMSDKWKAEGKPFGSDDESLEATRLFQEMKVREF